MHKLPWAFLLLSLLGVPGRSWGIGMSKNGLTGMMVGMVGLQQSGLIGGKAGLQQIGKLHATLKGLGGLRKEN